MKTLIKNAYVLTMDDDFAEYPRADILIDGSRITAVAPDIEIPTPAEDLRVIEAANHLALPGLVNAHVHSPGNFMKGALDGLPLEIFMLYEVPPLSSAPPDPRLQYVRTMLGSIEMLKLGITAVHDDAYYLPIPTPDAIDGIMSAYADSGIRAVATLDQPNVIEYEKYPFLHDLLPDNVRREMAAAPLMSTADLLGCYQYLIDTWHNACDGRIRAGVSVSAPQRVTVDYFRALSDISKALDIPFNVHILETKLQRVLGEEKYGRSLVKYVHDLGLLDERMMVVHAIWVDDEDIDLLAQAGCTVAHNPVCNMRLGSGIMPWRRLRDAGVPLCLGTDEANVDDTMNLWGVGKMAGLIHTITETDYDLWPQAREIVAALTRGGARAMRLEGKTGVLAPGYEADLILLDLNTLAFTPLNDVYRQLVYCENGSSVVLTMVGGEVVVQNGRVLTVDEEALKAEVRQLMETYRLEIQGISEAARRLEPYYREMYLRSANTEVGMNRWVPSTGADKNARRNRAP
jgi:cytosine/adenosine deaminase-related metal-dependent hydrolase